MTQRPRQRTRPLDGLRVLDLSRAVSGPLAGRILSDLGADVVRAELPGTDVTQAFGKVTRGRSGLYSHVNAGKRSILLDLHQPGDVARLLDLAAACDVLVENFRPGVLDRFGAGWAALSAVNPRLVMLSISGFGREGDDAGRAAYAPVIHAEAGLIGVEDFARHIRQQAVGEGKCGEIGQERDAECGAHARTAPGMHNALLQIAQHR